MGLTFPVFWKNLPNPGPPFLMPSCWRYAILASKSVSCCPLGCSCSEPDSISTSSASSFGGSAKDSLKSKGSVSNVVGSAGTGGASTWESSGSARAEADGTTSPASASPSYHKLVSFRLLNSNHLNNAKRNHVSSSLKVINYLHGLEWHGLNGLFIIPSSEKDSIERSDRFILRSAKSEGCCEP